jgi:hypothetical protein
MMHGPINIRFSFYAFSPREKSPYIHPVGGRVVPEIGLNMMVKIKMPCPC